MVSAWAADRVIETTTPDERAVRFAGLAAIAIETAVERVFREDPQDAKAVWFFAGDLQAAVASFKAAGGWWSETEIYDAKRLIVIAAAGQVKAGARSRLFTLGFGDALKRLSRGARAVIMVGDLREIVEAMQANTLTKAEAMLIINERIDKALARLPPLGGVALGGATAP